MSILDQAEELRQKAIALLVQERQAIDQKLSQLGYDGAPRELKRSCSNCGAADHNARRCPKDKTTESAAG
jgi:ribosomal protein S27AE